MSLNVLSRDYIVKQNSAMMSHVQNNAPRQALTVCCAVLREIDAHTTQIERQTQTLAGNDPQLTQRITELASSADLFAHQFLSVERALLRSAGFEPRAADMIIDELRNVRTQLQPPPNFTSSLDSLERLKDVVCAIVDPPSGYVSRAPGPDEDQAKLNRNDGPSRLDLRTRKGRRFARQAAVAATGVGVMVLNHSVDIPHISGLSMWVGNVLAETMTQRAIGVVADVG